MFKFPDWKEIGTEFDLGLFPGVYPSDELNDPSTVDYEINHVFLTLVGKNIWIVDFCGKCLNKQNLMFEKQDDFNNESFFFSSKEEAYLYWFKFKEKYTK